MKKSCFLYLRFWGSFLPRFVSVLIHVVAIWFTFGLGIQYGVIAFIVPCIIFAHGLFIIIMLQAFTTTPKLLERGFWEILLLDDGKAVYMNNLLPLKGKRYAIEIPKDYHDVGEPMIISTNLLAKLGYSVIDIDVELAFVFKKKLDPVNLFYLMMADYDIDNQGSISYGFSGRINLFNLEEYLISIFEQAVEQEQESIDAIASAYSRSEITEAEFLDQISKLLCFPKDKVPEIENVHFYLSVAGISTVR